MNILSEFIYFCPVKIMLKVTCNFLLFEIMNLGRQCTWIYPLVILDGMFLSVRSLSHTMMPLFSTFSMFCDCMLLTSPFPCPLFSVSLLMMSSPSIMLTLYVSLFFFILQILHSSTILSSLSYHVSIECLIVGPVSDSALSADILHQYDVF